jgi:hypothetical protein
MGTNFIIRTFLVRYWIIKKYTQLPVFGIYNLFLEEILGEVIFEKNSN